MQAITFNKQQYYLADELKKNYKNYFKGTSKGTRYIIDKKNIPESEFIYAKNSKNGWSESSATYKLAKLLLKKEFCETHIINSSVESKKDVKNVEEKKEKLQLAPSILHLDEEEMFKDADGNLLDIEVRGEREEDKIFFYCKDVAEKFGIPNLNDTITDSRSSYEKNIDYVLLGRPVNVLSAKKLPIKTIFLTYQGLLKVLFVSRNRNANYFRKWATKILFTMQMGEEDKKEELAAEALNVNVKDLRLMLKKHASTFPSIYLIKLAKVADVRKKMNISDNFEDDAVVFKYGMTEDLERRLAEHSRKFDKMANVKVDLVFYHFVDPKYVSKAEGKLKNYFEAFEKDIAYESEKELVILREREMKNVKEQFENIGIIYAGVSDVLQKKIDKMECDHKMEKMKMEHEIKMVKRENEHLVNQHEMEVRNYKLELKNRDLEMRLMSMEGRQ